MTPADLGQFVEGVTEAVAEHVGELSKKLDAALERITELEDRWANRPLVKDGIDGKDADPVNLEALALKAAALVPVPKDGEPGPAGADGVGADMAQLERLAIERVTALLEAWPKPKDGTSVTVDEVVPMVEAAVSKAVAALPVPKDPIGLVGTLIDRDGSLVVTLSDGSTRSIGPVVGRDGKDGKDVDISSVQKQVAEAIAALPVPQNGKDGKDGLGFEDLKADYDADGRLFLVFERSGVEPMRIWVPGLVYRGVFRDGEMYKKADCCTRDGSIWVAHEDTSAVPGAGPSPWQLAVKKGTEGKRGLQGEKGDKGLDGKDGVDRRGYR